ncbi:uncharacterized protein A1O5_09427 [Cladophialophora psammophila CBS 110553]|uniref:Uncharacterized protein n=1 Tax=Cladophialophora psammophila CBS 110553 TaxID=1182543 RepID=W9XAF8_9EURO|nr:uncharacterized protein A1O5_09427 [Cladophialophora psammophila CBS 110553]EXJ67414.1 hypothetical protein A1O5_09427 [Cladophialophora psammophila CBS 110553]
MEVIGAAASIATLIEVAKVAFELQHRFQEAPEKVKKSIHQVHYLAILLPTLLEVKENIHDERGVAEACATMLEACRHEIAALKDTLASITKGRHHGRIHWVLVGQTRAKELMTELAQVESSLTLVLNMLQCQRLQMLSEVTANLSQQMALAKRLVQRPNFCSCSHIERPSRDARGRKGAFNQKGTYVSRRTFGCANLATVAATVASLCRDGDYTSVLSLKLDLISKWGLQLEFSGWLPELRVDRILLSTRQFVPNNDPFMLACHDGDIGTVREVLSKNPASVTFSDEWERTPLCLAIEGGHVDICKELLGRGTRIDSTFGQYQTPAVSWALKLRKLDIARLLLSKGASLEHLSAWGWSPIFYLWAETRRHEESSLFLDILRSTDDFDWLHRGVVDTEGWTLLARCAVYGVPKDTLTLIKYGVDPSERAPGSEWTALHYVVYYGVVDAFFALFPIFQDRAGIELPDSIGWTLLHLAVGNGNAAVIRHLLENGADWKAETLPSYDEDIPDSIQGIPASAVQIALAYGEQRYLDFLDLLDELGLLENEGEADEVWSDAV